MYWIALSSTVNDFNSGSPSLILMVRRISFGITTRPRSSIRRTIPVAFILQIPPVALYFGKQNLVSAGIVALCRILPGYVFRIRTPNSRQIKLRLRPCTGCFYAPPGTKYRVPAQTVLPVFSLQPVVFGQDRHSNTPSAEKILILPF